MSNVSLFGKKWIDLVFEGKNKEYGAYQLRQESPRTTLTALFFGLLFFVSIGGLGLIFSSFGEKPIPVPPEPIVPGVTLVHLDELKPEEPAAPAAKKIDLPKSDVTKKDLINPKIVKPIDEPDDVRANNEPLTDPDPTEPGTIDGTSTTGTTTTTITTPIATTGNVNPNGIYRRGSLDKLPEYPGGIKKFNTYISNNFEKPELNSVKTLKVLVSFVIEKDGSISDIKILENPGEGLDKEAIRVLQSLRTKWKPGIKNGQPVRTLFTLPISIVTE